MTKFMIDNNEFTLTSENEYEGKLCVWGEEVTIFVDSQENQEKIVPFVQDKIKWIDENKDKIIDVFMEENSHYIEVINDMIEDGEFDAGCEIDEENFISALFINNVSLFLDEKDWSIMLDLEAEPDYLLGHLACIEIDSDYEIEFGGLNG